MSVALGSMRIFTSRACTVAALLFALVVCSLSLPGQSATGNISGTVTDASGAIIPKATVTLTDEATNSKRETVSNNSGVFNFASVLPATYSITISASGFRSWEERSITMTQGNNLNVPNIKLEVGTSKQEIQVVGNEIIVPTDTGAVTHSLNE